MSAFVWLSGLGELLFGAGIGSIGQAHSGGPAGVFGFGLLFLLLAALCALFPFLATSIASVQSAGRVPVSGRRGLRIAAHLAVIAVGAAIGADLFGGIVASVTLVSGMAVLVFAMLIRDTTT